MGMLDKMNVSQMLSAWKDIIIHDIMETVSGLLALSGGIPMVIGPLTKGQ